LYNNPSVECAITRSQDFNERPAVVVLHTDGKEMVYDTRSMAGELPGRVDREVFRLLAVQGGAGESTAREAAEVLAANAPVGRGAGKPSRKGREMKAAAAAAAVAEASPGEAAGGTAGAAEAGGGSGKARGGQGEAGSGSGGGSASGGSGGGSGKARGGQGEVGGKRGAASAASSTAKGGSGGSSGTGRQEPLR
jgi:hypothetical protein